MCNNIANEQFARSLMYMSQSFEDANEQNNKPKSLIRKTLVFLAIQIYSPFDARFHSNEKLQSYSFSPLAMPINSPTERKSTGN